MESYYVVLNVPYSIKEGQKVYLYIESLKDSIYKLNFIISKKLTGVVLFLIALFWIAELHCIQLSRVVYELCYSINKFETKELE
jgi:hypothetical protein